MGVAGMKQGPRPPILLSFFTKLNEEALLKVSLKNIHRFKVAHFLKILVFENRPKNLTKKRKISKIFMFSW